ncbi:hypothetical protein MTO96_007982 [Rhipicephalus appendiculatus]
MGSYLLPLSIHSFCSTYRSSADDHAEPRSAATSEAIPRPVGEAKKVPEYGGCVSGVRRDFGYTSKFTSVTSLAHNDTEGIYLFSAEVSQYTQVSKVHEVPHTVSKAFEVSDIVS